MGFLGGRHLGRICELPTIHLSIENARAVHFVLRCATLRPHTKCTEVQRCVPRYKNVRGSRAGPPLQEKKVGHQAMSMSESPLWEVCEFEISAYEQSLGVEERSTHSSLPPSCLRRTPKAYWVRAAASIHFDTCNGSTPMGRTSRDKLRVNGKEVSQCKSKNCRFEVA